MPLQVEQTRKSPKRVSPCPSKTSTEPNLDVTTHACADSPAKNYTEGGRAVIPNSAWGTAEVRWGTSGFNRAPAGDPAARDAQRCLENAVSGVFEKIASVEYTFSDPRVGYLSCGARSVCFRVKGRCKIKTNSTAGPNTYVGIFGTRPAICL